MPSDIYTQTEAVKYRSENACYGFVYLQYKYDICKYMLLNVLIVVDTRRRNHGAAILGITW